MAVLAPRRGFLRESSQYRIDPSGLAIEYRIVDKEVFKRPPFPAYKADGAYRETTTRGGAYRSAEVWVRLRGDKFTNQADLLLTAIRLCAGKLAAREAQLLTDTRLDGTQPGFTILEYGEAEVKMFENEVSFRLRCALNIDPQRVVTIDAFVDLNTFTPLTPEDTGQEYTPAYLARGSAGILLQAAKYFDPSLRETKLDDYQLNRGFEVGTAGRRPEPLA